jgi:diamine N-acetyltransferase
MSSLPPQDNENRVVLRPVNRDNFRDITALTVSHSQREFVTEPCYYLVLCAYGGDWHPLAVSLGEKVIGFLMWAVDPADGSCWLGGIIIDQNYQRQGYGRQTIQAAIAMLSEEHGYRQFALSYSADNGAKHLYQALGFNETGEMEGDEVVARLPLAANKVLK